jgi:hypothetical protein
MAPELSPVIDDFQIGYLHHRHGWARLTFTQGEFRSEEFVTEITGEGGASCLIQFCLAVVRNEPVTRPFYDEPGGVVWRATPDPARQHLTLFEIFEIAASANLGEFDMAECGQPIFRMITKRRFLATAIVMELAKTVLLLQEVSYKKDRQGFPFDDFCHLVEAWTATGWAKGLDLLGLEGSNVQLKS